MKPHVLVETQDPRLREYLQEEAGPYCRLTFTPTTAITCAHISSQRPAAVVLDPTRPDFDLVEVAHTLRHAAGAPPRVALRGPVSDPLVLPGEPVTLGRARRSLVHLLRAWFDPRAAQTLQTVRYRKDEAAFFVVFRDGKSYELSRNVIEADDGAAVVGDPEVINRGDAFRVRLRSGTAYTVAWDFVLYHQEPTYPYHKDRPSQRALERQRAERISARVRQARARRGWSLEEMARRTGIHAPNLSRLESGAHVPSLPTLERVAEALGLRVVDLVAA